MTNKEKQMITIEKAKKIEEEFGMSLMNIYTELGKTMTRFEINEKLGFPKRAYPKFSKLCKKTVRQWASCIFITGMSNQQAAKELGKSVPTLNKMLRCGYKVVKVSKDKYELKPPKFLQIEEYLQILANKYGGLNKLKKQLEKWIDEDGYYQSKVTLKLKMPSIHITKAICLALDVGTQPRKAEKPVDQELLKLNALYATWFNSFTCKKRVLRRMDIASSF